MRVHFNLSYICTRNFSQLKAGQLASKTVVALSEQHISQALYFENIFFGIE